MATNNDEFGTNAAIDVGSNSVRLLYRGKKQVEITALAEGLLASGVLKSEAIRRTAEAVFRLKKDAVAHGATCIFVFATEAVRAAANRADFTSALAAGGVNLDIIPAEREAKLGFSGAYTRGTCAVVDIGGASTEVAVGDQNGLIYACSVPVGCVRLFEYSADKKEEISYFRKRAEEYGTIPTFGDLIIIGGTSSTFVALNEKMTVYDPEVVHGYRLKRADVIALTDLLDATPLERRAEIAGMHPKKALTSVSSGVLLQEIMHFFQRESCIVSERDNLEGYLIQKQAAR